MQISITDFFVPVSGYLLPEKKIQGKPKIHQGFFYLFLFESICVSWTCSSNHQKINGNPVKMKKSYELNWFPKLRLGYVSLLERFSAFFHSCFLGFLFKFLSEILSYSYRRFYPRFKQFFPEKILENIAGFLKSKYCLLKVFMRIL